MDEEYNALLRNQTWHLVSPHQASNVIDCKWVYKIKRSKMVLCLNIRQDWLLRGSSNVMGLIIVILLAWW
jgi:hypothetical protein